MLGGRIFGFRRVVAAILLVTILGSVAATSAIAATAPNASLAIGMPIHDLPLCKTIVRPGDIFRSKMLESGVSAAQQDLSTLPVANRMVEFVTTVGLETKLNQMTVPISYLGYDFEGWVLTSQWERDNPVAAVKLASQIAHSRGLKLVLMTTHAWTKNYGAQMAPYVDIFIPQAKGIMASSPTPASYAATVRPVWIALKKANPNMQIWMDVSPNPKGVQLTPAEMQAYVALVKDLVSGVWITHTVAYKTDVANFIKTYFGR